MQNTRFAFGRAGRTGLAIVCFAAAIGTWLLVNRLSANPSQPQDKSPSHTPVLVLPESPFLSPETRAALRRAKDRSKEDDTILDKCPSDKGADRAAMPEIRKCQAEAFYKTALYKDFRDQYSVSITPKTIGGVYTEIFTPAEGIAKRNEDRVLINVHGGGFLGGARKYSHVESIPVAAIGKIKIVSIDYRMAPEFRFPAASEDVAAVYREIIKSYKPKNIGIFGCSAGGLLTAQAMAWFQKEKLPLPGAIGMLCEGGNFWMDGDSGQFMAATSDRPANSSRENAYLKDASPNDPLAFPAESVEVMAKFPPSLLVSSSRDFALSSVIRTHSLLVQQGVEAELHVWEGLEHAFFYNPDLPESKEAYRVVVRFFDRHLGQERKP
jgi:acetyl esterase/lipase